MAEQQTSQQPQWERSPDFRTIFSNHFNFRFAPGDGNITFSQLVDAPGSAMQNIVMEQINITMSWPQIKNLVRHLNAVVQEMEEEYGPITTIGLTDEELRQQASYIISGFTGRKK